MAVNVLTKADELPSKRVTEIHSSIKQLKGLQKGIKFQWVASHCGVNYSGSHPTVGL